MSTVLLYAALRSFVHCMDINTNPNKPQQMFCFLCWPASKSVAVRDAQLVVNRHMLTSVQPSQAEALSQVQAASPVKAANSNPMEAAMAVQFESFYDAQIVIDRQMHKFSPAF